MRMAAVRWVAPVLVVVLAVAWASLGAAETKIEKTAYGGWPNCMRMSNGTVELVATTDVGPRVIRFGFVGKDNEFFEDKEQLGKTNADEWLAFGGHRLWLAPMSALTPLETRDDPDQGADRGAARSQDHPHRLRRLHEPGSALGLHQHRDRRRGAQPRARPDDPERLSHRQLRRRVAECLPRTI